MKPSVGVRHLPKGQRRRNFFIDFALLSSPVRRRVVLPGDQTKFRANIAAHAGKLSVGADVPLMWHKRRFLGSRIGAVVCDGQAGDGPV